MSITMKYTNFSSTFLSCFTGLRTNEDVGLAWFGLRSTNEATGICGVAVTDGKRCESGQLKHDAVTPVQWKWKPKVVHRQMPQIKYFFGGVRVQSPAPSSSGTLRRHSQLSPQRTSSIELNDPNLR
ncbi:hypothetical protein J6590_056588 [Homalodisca vitripennis]|nr:hypothetical protein J6590_056588 [Homalodisca vitripennis]